MNIFDSYINAGQQLGRSDREKYYTAIIEFMAYDAEPTNLRGAALAVFMAIRPSLEISKARSRSGSKGGAKAQANRQASAGANDGLATDFATEQSGKQSAGKQENSQEANGQGNSKGKGNSKKKEDLKLAESVRQIVAYLNERTGKHYKPTTPKTRALIAARMREGFSLADFRAVIDHKAEEWANDPKMARYLRPETLFGTKFEGYLNQDARGVGADDGYRY